MEDRFLYLEDFLQCDNRVLLQEQGDEEAMKCPQAPIDYPLPFPAHKQKGTRETGREGEDSHFHKVP